MIEIKNVTKRFGDFTAVEDVNITVGMGCIYGLTGYNGAGKTTLLRCCAGIYKPEKGEALIGGINAFDNDTNRFKLFFVPDELFFRANSSMSSMAKFYSGYYPDFRFDVFEKIAGLFGLDIKKKLRGFSKGMQRQAEIAIALAARPKNLLLDEAFDGLDPEKRHIAKQMFVEYASETGCSVIISSHNLSEIGELCDRIGMIKGKKILFDLNVDDIPIYYKKFSVIFDRPIDTEALSLPPCRLKISGRALTVTAMGNAPQVAASLNALAPADIKAVPMNASDVFLEETQDKSDDIAAIFADTDSKGGIE